MKKLFCCISIFLLTLTAFPAFAYTASSKSKRLDLINQALDSQEHTIQRKRQHRKGYQRSEIDPRNIQTYERVYSEQEINQYQRQRGDYMELLEEKDPQGEKSLITKFDVISGWRKDDLDWNVAGLNGGAPNVANEYIWTDLKTYSLGGRANFALKNKIILDGVYRYGWIYEGTGSVSEYDGNGRTSQATEIKADAGKGNTLDMSGALGYKMYLGEQDILDFNDFWITWYAGYSLRELNLNLQDGDLRVDSSGMLPLGGFEGLDSPYDAEWKGPWLGFELAGDMSKRLAGDFSFQYHFADYDAVGQLNLNPNFAQPQSFKQNGDGYGMVFNVGMDLKLTQQLFLNFDGSYEEWEVDGGEDRAFLSGGGTQDTRLNDVSWRNYGFSAGMTYQFD